MKLLPNWGAILKHSFSMHLTYWGLAALLAATIVALAFGRHLFDPLALLLFSIAMLALTIPGRVISQGISDGTARPRFWKSVAISAGVAAVVMLASSVVARADQPLQLAMAGPPPVTVIADEDAPIWAEVEPHAVPLVARWEGLRPEAYLDTIASPPVWTVCYGETDNVTPGEVRTVEECERGLSEGLHRYWTGWRNTLPEETAMSYLTPHRDAAFASFAWNVGIAGAAGSTATARLNRGDIPGACEAMTWWNRAGGIVIRGLVNRRSEEREFCMRGV